MRQITRLIDNGKGAVRQIHLLTTRTDLTPGELLFRMGSRWRQENHFRYARMHFDLDSQDAYAVSDDDAERMVPNPAKKTAHARVVSATARHAAAKAATDAALLTARSQISTTADFIDSRRGGVGADARTRLAEAQRLLTIAEAEADPVTALDTARSSATYSRDADALARYDVMGRDVMDR